MEILGRKVNDVYSIQCLYHLNCSPGRLELKKNKYIHLLKSLRPHGLNTANPFVPTVLRSLLYTFYFALQLSAPCSLLH